MTDGEFGAEASNPGPGRYADQVRIIHRLVDFPGQPAESEFEVIISPQGIGVDADWLNDAIEDIHLEFDEQAGRKLQHSPFALSQTRNHHSWGADAQVITFILETALPFAGVVGGTLVVEHGWQKLIDKLTSLGYDVRHGKVETLTDAAAERHGLSLITSEYGRDASDLQVTAVAHNRAEDTSTVTAADSASGRYTVVFHVRGDSPKLIECKKESA